MIEKKVFADAPNKMPLIPVKDLVVFPYMLLPLYIGRESSLKAVENCLKGDRFLFLTSQKDSYQEDPGEKDLYEIGTFCKVMRTRQLSDGRMKVLVQGIGRGKIKNYIKDDSFTSVEIEKIESISTNTDAEILKPIIEDIKKELSQLVELGQAFTQNILNVVEDLNEPDQIADLVASHLGLKTEQLQHVLETFDVKYRLNLVLRFTVSEREVLEIQNQITNRASQISRSQRSGVLKDQMKALKDELNEGDPKFQEISELDKKIKSATMPESTEKEALKQLNRLKKLMPESSEASIIRNYLETLSELPWSIHSEESLDLKEAEKILSSEHYGLDKVKERILEFLAVYKLNKGKKIHGPILCFSGPPGVGKTSLGKSIAKALGREYHRISLGGVKDESEIRGHRRTYIGAMPGKLIQALKQVKVNNPVIVLDEIDKLGSDFKGDPSAAMLEVLDPEQNKTFRDNYLNVEFDLSNILFITTANVLENIPPALRDRMEVLQISGYTKNEKSKIAKLHIVKKQISGSGLPENSISFTDEGLAYLISHYTREAGLRNLERQVGSICRKVAKKHVMGNTKHFDITPELISDFLGAPTYTENKVLSGNYVGVATGLAWTQVGGEILYVESLGVKGKGELTLTGQLGDVMKESATAAISYIESKHKTFAIDPEWFKNNKIHIHLPAGAIPKDGPSAGVTIFTSVLSLIKNTPVPKDIAMTGEITLTGRVLPVGGIREKTLAALSQGISKIILPLENKKDTEDIPKEYKEKMEFIYVTSLKELVDVIFSDKKIDLAEDDPVSVPTSHKSI